jgi:transcriptional regulator with XRE-family HTH domain
MDTIKKIKDLETALQIFEKTAMKHAKATEVGDYKTANKCYILISKVIVFLKEANEIKSLSNLLTHSSVGVRIWAATYLLPILEDEGILVLEQIAGKTGIHALSARTTLSEWKKGNLKL